jgi:hypothetical protein
MVNVIEPQFNLHSEDANVSCKGYFSIKMLFLACDFSFKKIIVYYGFSGPLFLLLLGCDCPMLHKFAFTLFVYFL